MQARHSRGLTTTPILESSRTPTAARRHLNRIPRTNYRDAGRIIIVGIEVNTDFEEERTRTRPGLQPHHPIQDGIAGCTVGLSSPLSAVGRRWTLIP